MIDDNITNKTESGILTGTITGTIVATRIQSTQPTGFRVGQYPDGSKRVQGAYVWQEGWDRGGVEWRDLPVVLVGADGQEIKP